ncbi:MAG: S8 family serine peptidase [Armatimonadetes bacterium]|nr:S8 family serine peptidase [Armatimonadota bacterium]
MNFNYLDSFTFRVTAASRGAVIGLLLLVSSLSSHPTHAQRPDLAYVPNELLIKFKEGVTEAQKNSVLHRVSARLQERVHTPAMEQRGESGIARISVPGAVPNAIQQLRPHPFVAYVEPNWILKHRAASNDPGYTRGYLWGLYGDATEVGLRNAYGSQAGEAWAAGHTGSKEVYVGVIDEGMQVTHPDLQANVWTNPFDPIGDANGDGNPDDDGNGYMDDRHGWDFYNSDNTVYDTGQDDHGTHVAGTIGAVGGNGVGVVGVNWDVTLISAKFLGVDGGTTLDAIKAIDYFTDLKARHGLNIVALNNSWGGGDYSQALHDAILRAAKAEILFIVAAGNGDEDRIGDDNDTIPDYPGSYSTLQGTTTEAAATYDAVVSVAAIDANGALASFSNYGRQTVELGAPGVGITSTLPSNAYGTYSGTSMAAPHVTGAAALFASTHSGATAAEIREALLNSTLPTDSLVNRTVTGGRLDLSQVIMPPPAPAAPTGLTATPAANDQVHLAWTDNSTDELGFEIEGSADGLNWAQAGVTAASTAHFTVSELRPDTLYSFRVRAYHRWSPSGYSNVASASPLDTLSPSIRITAPQWSTTVSGTVTITADASDNVGVTTVEFYANGELIGSDTIAPYSASWDTALQPNGYYTLTVVASDAAGNRSSSSSGNRVQNITPDTSPPGVGIMAPLWATTVTGAVTVMAEAWDDTGVTQVEFHVNGELIGTDTTAPYSMDWDTTVLPNGYHSLTVTASDAAGNRTSSSSGNTVQNITPDTTPPGVGITGPQWASTVSGTVTITADAWDDTGVTQVEFYVNGELIGTDTTAPYSMEWNTTGLPNGYHSVMVIATDAAGNRGSASSGNNVGNAVTADKEPSP